jgi:hypothetical protein
MKSKMKLIVYNFEFKKSICSLIQQITKKNLNIIHICKLTTSNQVSIDKYQQFNFKFKLLIVIAPMLQIMEFPCNFYFGPPYIALTIAHTRVGAKFVQDGISRETFVHKFVTSIIFYQSDMCTLYLNPSKTYDHPQF